MVNETERRKLMSLIKYIVLDVDGTLTDSGIYYDENGNELKKFSTKDAAGIFAARALGIQTIVLTGRECKATMRRMEELGIEHIYQNVKKKDEFLRNYLIQEGIDAEDIGYIGDDINDYASMKLCGFRGCPADSCDEIKQISNYVSNVNGGHGAVRDIIEHYIKSCGKWDELIKDMYGVGV